MDPRLKTSSEFTLENYSFSLGDYFWKAESIIRSSAATESAVLWGIDWWSLFQGVMKYNLKKI